MMAATSTQGVLAAGNFIVDHVNVIDEWPPQDGLARIVQQTRHNGGGPYNVLKDLARLGAKFPLRAAGRIGDDADGQWIREDFAATAIDVGQLRTTPGAPTSFTQVMSVRDTGRRTFFHAPGANAMFAPEDLTFTPAPRLFYLGYLLLLDQFDVAGPDGRAAAAAALARAHAAGALTVLDCVSENSDRFGSVIRPILPEVDILFANDFEAERLTGRSLGRGACVDREAVAAAAQDLLKQGVRQLACIHFPEGACAAAVDGSVVWQPAVALPVAEIVGTSGAGDAFAAGVIFGVHENWRREDALRLGVCAAAACLRHASCSDSILSASACLELGQRHGFRSWS